MKNETATLDCVNKIITFKFKNEVFTVDLKEGDLPDSWNSITDKDGVMWDINFSWEDTKGCRPALAVYGLVDDGSGQLIINTSDETSIKILGRPSADVYFKEERFRYVWDVTSALICRIYTPEGKEIAKTRSFNRACDELYFAKKKYGKEAYMIAQAVSNNGTKIIK